MKETPEQIITDEAIDSVWQGANFGPHLTEREVIRNTLLKFACGWSSGKTAHRIVAALGLAAINKQTLTKLGREYLWACYSNGEGKDSPYQGSAGTWRSAAKPPGITQWYVVKCEQRRFASLIYVDSKITLERVAKDIDVEIDLLEWLDDSAASPAGDGLAPHLEEMIKREPVTFFLINALRYLDYKQRLLLIESLRERTIVEAVLPSPPNKIV